MEEKREQLRQRDEEFQEKRERLFAKIQEMEERQLAEGMDLLEDIEDKCNKAQGLKFKVIKRRTSDVHRKNFEAEQRLKEFYAKEEKRQAETAEKYIQQRLKMDKKVEKHLKETGKYSAII